MIQNITVINAKLGLNKQRRIIHENVSICMVFI